MTMRAGTLRHRITIEEATVVENEFGEPEQSWAAFAERWARVSPLEGQERWNAQQVHAEVTHEIELRHLDGVKAEMRVNFGGRLFDIEAPMNPDERDEKLILLCTERVE